ncbi:MAG: alfa-L-rhamnosidase [Ruminococcaceae bacterium]|nr:alfa-L-rhamnosidase [Oscillospiraceae bacterium]
MSIIKRANWIRPKYDMKEEVVPLFRREFVIKKPVKKAIMYITAMGVYEATLNGKRVGNFIMAPGWTQYDKRHQYQEYDITSLLKESNVIDVTVGKGWYRGQLVGWRYKNIYGRQTAFIAAIDFEYEDGTKEILITDNEWKYCWSNIRFSEIYDGEEYVADYEPLPVENCEILYSNKENLIPQEGPFVIEHETILPNDIFYTPKGELVVDFGQNMTGYVSFTINGCKEDKIVYTHAEVLDKDGNFYTDNLRSAKQKIEYYCKDGIQTYKPHHTFMGFRYIRVEDGQKYVTKENFKAIVVHSDIKRTGYFKCSDEKVNKLYENSIWSQKGNFLDIPTDCPQRDERLGWTGDAQVFVKTAAYNFDVRTFFKKWLKDLAAGQDYSGAVPNVIPVVITHQQMATGAAWGDAAVVCPWYIYLTYNDKEVLSEQLDSMKAWVEYMHQSGPEEYLWLGHIQFGDWLGMDGAEGSLQSASNHDLVASAFYAYSTGLLAKILDVLDEDSTYYKELNKKIVGAFKRKFDGNFNTQTECVLALHFNLTDHPQKTADKLAELVKNNGNRLTTGFVGTPYLLFALSDNGYTDLAYTLLLQEEYPSWLFSVNMGATTIWEHWDSLKADGSMWSVDMNSFNHYAYGSVASWMYETVCGIKIDEKKPGFENVILCPKPDSRLTYAESGIETAYGVVKSRWDISDGKITYRFTVPNEATLILDGDEMKLTRGEYEFDKIYKK